MIYSDQWKEFKALEFTSVYTKEAPVDMFGVSVRDLRDVCVRLARNYVDRNATAYHFLEFEDVEGWSLEMIFDGPPSFSFSPNGSVDAGAEIIISKLVLELSTGEVVKIGIDKTPDELVTAGRTQMLYDRRVRDHGMYLMHVLSNYLAEQLKIHILDARAFVQSHVTMLLNEGNSLLGLDAEDLKPRLAGAYRLYKFKEKNCEV